MKSSIVNKVVDVSAGQLRLLYNIIRTLIVLGKDTNYDNDNEDEYDGKTGEPTRNEGKAVIEQRVRRTLYEEWIVKNRSMIEHAMSRLGALFDPKDLLILGKGMAAAREDILTKFLEILDDMITIREAQGVKV